MDWCLILKGKSTKFIKSKNHVALRGEAALRATLPKEAKNNAAIR